MEFEGKLAVALDEALGGAIGKGLGKVAGWGAGQLLAGAKGLVKGAGEGFKSVDAPQPAKPAAAKAKAQAPNPVAHAVNVAWQSLQKGYSNAPANSDAKAALGDVKSAFRGAVEQNKARIVGTPKAAEAPKAYQPVVEPTPASQVPTGAYQAVAEPEKPATGAYGMPKIEPSASPETPEPKAEPKAEAEPKADKSHIEPKKDEEPKEEPKKPGKVVPPAELGAHSGKKLGKKGEEELTAQDDVNESKKFEAWLAEVVAGMPDRIL